MKTNQIALHPRFVKRVAFFALLFAGLLVNLCTFAAPPGNDDAAIKLAIRKFLINQPGGARLTERAKFDITQTTWPEVTCKVEEELDSPAGFVKLTVYRVAPGRYKYKCVCPRHGDVFVDYCTMSAYRDKRGQVWISHVSWGRNPETWVDEPSPFAKGMKSARWVAASDGVKIPSFMLPGRESQVNDDFFITTYDGGEVSVVCAPVIGAWAVASFPSKGNYITNYCRVMSIKKNYGNGVIEGYGTDGRIWFMKTVVMRGRVTSHLKFIAVLYPPMEESHVGPLKAMVRNWK